MRPLATWLVVGALAVVGLFAARDALRAESGPSLRAEVTARQPHPPPLGGPPAISGRAAFAISLARIGARGFLSVTDVSCRRFVLSLPELRWTVPAGSRRTDCGLWARPPAETDSGIAARQVDASTIEVTSGGWSHAFAGTAPAFKPDGTLTFVHRGTLYEWTARCPQGVEIVRFQGLHDVPRCARPVAGAPDDLREVAWLGARDYAAVAGPDAAMAILVVRGARERTLFTAVGSRVGSLEASPGGRYLAARVDGRFALFRTDAPGPRALPSANELVRAIAWSPDDRLAALATDRSVHVFPVERPGEDVPVPLSIAAVSWR